MRQRENSYDINTLLKFKITKNNNIERNESKKDDNYNILKDYISSNIIKKVAHDEAKLIIEEAKRNASQIVNDALLEAEKAEIEADQLRRSLKIYKARIKQTIEEQLTMVDDVDKIEEDYKG